MTPTLLRHETLENERRWALLFGAAALLVGFVVSTYDVDEESVGPLIAISMLPVAGYWLRALLEQLPAWGIVVITALAQAGAAVIDSDAEGNAFLMLLALFYLFFREVDRTAAKLVALIAVPLPFILTILGAIDGDGWLYWTMGNLICSFFGSLAYSLRILASELEQQRTRAVDAAIFNERQRIARDVHDMVGHSLSVMMLHLTAARRTVTEQPEQATSTLAQAEDVGRTAMAEIRRTIGMLAGPTNGRSEAEATTDPVPGLSDLEALVGQYAQAGLDTELIVEGDQTTLDGARSIAAYRIVQEALVNAAKHTNDAKVCVEARQGGTGWTVRVTNRGGTLKGPTPRSPKSMTDQSQSTAGTSNGFGLVGMEERARSVGGSLLAGPIDDGWRIEAMLPGLAA